MSIMLGGLEVGKEMGEKGSLNADDPIITPAKKMIEHILYLWRLLTLVLAALEQLLTRLR